MHNVSCYFKVFHSGDLMEITCKLAEVEQESKSSERKL